MNLFSIIISAVGLLSCGPHTTESSINKDQKNFAVVELFTSEGCSSCPPADEAAIHLAKEFPNSVYVLGFHVDYWDRLGWKDKYSNADYTARQQQYASKFSLESIYTPQVILNGKKELVGSKE